MQLLLLQYWHQSRFHFLEVDIILVYKIYFFGKGYGNTLLFVMQN